MQRDVAEYVKRCKQCQRHTPVIHQPTRNLNPINNPWSFAQWGLDIIVPFPQAIGNRRFVLVAVDYFIKWVKTKALANIRDINVKKFVWKSIVARFGVLESLVLDNKLEFDHKAFSKDCGGLGIKKRYLTLAYPHSNGQAEAVNKAIVTRLKKRLKGAKGKWTKELPNVLWAYQTTP